MPQAGTFAGRSCDYSQRTSVAAFPLKSPDWSDTIGVLTVREKVTGPVEVGMSKVCAVCGKKVSTGNRIARRGRAKRLGGVGIKTTGVSRRKFQPNIQRVRALVNGTVKRVKVCAKCIRRGKIQKPPI